MSPYGIPRRFAAVRRFGRDRSEADMPRASGAGRSDENDPTVWSGRAVQEVSSTWLKGLALLYPASDWSVCSGPSWTSARMRADSRTSLERASWVTSVRTRREDRLLHRRLILSQTSAGKRR